MTTSHFDESKINRQADGQFGTKQHAEAALGAGGVDLAPERLTLNDPRVAEALGCDPASLTADEQRLLGVLIDPDVANDYGWSDDPDEILAEFEDFDGDGLYEISGIAERVSSQYDSMSYVLETSYPGSSEWQYSVAQYCGHEVGYLSSTSDTKHLDARRHLPDGEHTGLRKALAMAVHLDGDFQMVRGRALRLGLIEQTDQPSSQEATA